LGELDGFAIQFTQISELSPLLAPGGEKGDRGLRGGCLHLIASNDSLQDADLHYRVWDADTDQLAVEGDFLLPANQNWQVASIPVAEGEQRLFLIEWELGGVRSGNHYLFGAPPFSLDRYRLWLPKIAALPRAFVAQEIAR
jgi:hypothetical protein